MTSSDPQGAAAPSVQELHDREAIRALIHRFCRGADRDDRELVYSCFHPDAIDEHGIYSGPAHGFYDRPDADDRRLAMHHLVGQIDIELQGDRASSESYCAATVVRDTDDGPLTRLLAVRYVDRCEKRHGEWRIAHRFVVFDAEVYVPGGVPERIPTRNWGRRDKDDPSYRLPPRDVP